MRRLFTITIASLLLAGPSYGAVLTSAPVSSLYSGDYLVCLVRNVSNDPVDVTLGFLDFSGNVLGATLTDTVPPGGSKSIAANPEPLLASSCRITVPGSAKKIRASALYWDPDTFKYNVVLPVE